MLALSDSTFAVAITLLIFDVRFAGPDRGVAEDLWYHQWPHYTGYFVSFAVIGMLWLNHHAIFRLIRHIDHGVLVLNLAFLGVVVFMPFPTQVMAAYLSASDGEEVYVAVFYGLTMAAATLVLALLWHYAARRHHLLESWVPRDASAQLTRRLYVTPVLLVLATLLGLIDVRLGLVLFLVVTLGYLLHTGARVAPRHPASGHIGARDEASGGHEPGDRADGQ